MNNPKNLHLLVETLLSGPPFRDLDGIRSIEAKGKGAFFLADGASEEGKVFIKVYRRGGLLGRFVQGLYLNKNRFKKEFDMLLKLKNLGFNVPEPLGFVTKRAFGPFYKGALLSRYIEGLRPLSCVLPQLMDDKLLEEIARILLDLHEKGIEHKDLNLSNFLLSRDRRGGEASLVILDFDKAKQHPRPLSAMKRAYGLIRMERSAKKMFGETFARTFFERLFSAYSKKLETPERRRLQRAVFFMRPLFRLRYKLSDRLHV